MLSRSCLCRLRVVVSGRDVRGQPGRLGAPAGRGSFGAIRNIADMFVGLRASFSGYFQVTRHGITSEPSR